MYVEIVHIYLCV